MSTVGTWFKEKRCWRLIADFAPVSRSQRGELLLGCDRFLVHCPVTRWRKNIHAKKRDMRRGSRDGPRSQGTSTIRWLGLSTSWSDDAPTPSQVHFTPRNCAETSDSTCQTQTCLFRDVIRVPQLAQGLFVRRRIAERMEDQIGAARCYGCGRSRNSRRFVIWVRPRCAHDFHSQGARGKSSRRSASIHRKLMTSSATDSSSAIGE